MSEREKTLYNKKALDQIRSPEQMNGYLKVTTPQVWIILAAVIFLLAGFSRKRQWQSKLLNGITKLSGIGLVLFAVWLGFPK